MAFIDQDLVLFDSAAALTAASQVIDLDADNLNHGLGNSPADYLNIEVVADLTGTLVTKLQDSADDSSFADVSGMSYTFAVDALAGAGTSILLNKDTRRYIKQANSGATGGNVLVWIGQRKF